MVYKQRHDIIEIQKLEGGISIMAIVIDKRVIDARCVHSLLEFETRKGEALTAYEGLYAVLSGCGYNDKQIKDIVDIEKITTALEAMVYGTMLEYVEQAMKTICRYDGKTYGEIEQVLSKVIADSFSTNIEKVSPNSVDIYTSFKSQINTLIRLGKVIAEDDPHHARRKLYRYIG